MSSAVHFYLTFNPYLNKENNPDYTQVHEFHELLSSCKLKNKKSTAFWGKIIAKDRTPKVVINDFEKAINQNKENNCSTHLYITDFRALWVAKVESVTQKLPNKAQTLDFYRDKNVEIWFELSDLLLLEYKQEASANKLSEFYIDNEYMDLTIDGLSPFTTAVRYPCFIQDLAESQYFDEMDESEEPFVLRPHKAVASTSTEKVLHSLQNYVFPISMYQKLPHAAKMEIESAELDMLESRHHNLGRTAFALIKALEVIVNDLTIHHLKRSGFGDEFFVDDSTNPPKLHLEDRKENLMSLKHFQKNFSMGQIFYFMDRCHKSGNGHFKKAFAAHKPFVRYFLGEFRTLVDENEVIAIRGILAHNDSSQVSANDAQAIRNLLLGVGGAGIIPQLYRNFYHEQFKNLDSIENSYSNKDDQQSPKARRAQLKLVG